MEIVKIDVKKIRNIRTLSQYVTKDGLKIKKNSLIRSDRLDRISDKKRKKFFEEYNIKTVIDLRTPVEVSESGKFKHPDFIDYYHIPVLDQAYFGITHEKSMVSIFNKTSQKISDENGYYDFIVNMYKNIALNPKSQEEFKKIFDIFLNHNEGGILYHCTGGKDRTGMVSLFILTILGVDREVILADYTRSDIENAKHNKIVSKILKIFVKDKKFKTLLIEMLYAKREYLEKTIEAIEEEYGSIINYLEVAIGINEDKRNRLKEIFLEK